jgi:RimJ/RimL family protein N-acetyltransferase
MNPLDLRLSTERLHLVPLTTQFSLQLYSLESDPEVVKFQGYDPKTFEQCENYAKESEQSWFSSVEPEWREFAILIADSFIGRVGFQIESKEATIWFALLPAHQRKGYATEAVRRIFEYLKQIGIVEVEANCEIENLASAALLTKCGMIELQSTDPQLRMFSLEL